MKTKPILLLFLVVAALFGLYQLQYWLGYASDLRSRPWAYSTDPNAKLLVGKWQGSFRDPAGVEKKISLEIFEPVTEEERQKRASRKRGLRGLRHENKRAFGGAAVVQSRLGEERYELYGAVEKEDLHRLKISFRPEDEAKRVLPNDTLHSAPTGRWEGDLLEVQLAFSRQDAQGFSSSHSEGVVVDGKVVWQDSPEEKPIAVVLSRVP